MMMNVKTKSIIAAVLLVAGLVSAFAISRWQSSPDTHAASIQYLDEKQETVMKLTAASTAASVAVSALPGDTGDAVSQKLMDLNSKFLIVLCAVMLEKYLLRDFLQKLPSWLRHFYTLVVVFVGWGVFAMENLTVCAGYFKTCFGSGTLWSSRAGSAP